MRVSINKVTQGVVGLNRPIAPFDIEIDVKDSFNITKVIHIQDGLKQKENDQGQLLYKDNVVVNELSSDELFDEVITKEKIISFDKVPRIYKSFDEQDEVILINTFEKVPTEIEELDPVMIPNMVNKVTTLVDNSTEFTAEDILTEIYQELLDETEMDCIIADVFLSEDDIDLKSSSHAANTGPGFIQLLGYGQCKLKQTDLDCSSEKFRLLEFKSDDGVEVYIAGKKFENEIVVLMDPIESCTIKFINTTNKPKNIHSFAIGYQEVIE